jgi:hypothetical protein
LLRKLGSELMDVFTGIPSIEPFPLASRGSRAGNGNSPGGGFGCT